MTGLKWPPNVDYWTEACVTEPSSRCQSFEEFAAMGRADRLVTLACPEHPIDLGRGQEVARIEMVERQSLYIVGCASLNKPGEYCIEQVWYRPRVHDATATGKFAACEQPGSTGKFSEPGYIEEVRYGGPERLLLAGGLDAATFTAEGLCPVEWGVSTPLVAGSVVVVVRRLSPESKLLFAMFGKPAHAHPGFDC